MVCQPYLYLAFGDADEKYPNGFTDGISGMERGNPSVHMMKALSIEKGNNQYLLPRNAPHDR